MKPLFRLLLAMVAVVGGVSSADAYVQFAFKTSENKIVQLKFASPTVTYFIDGGGTGVAGADAASLVAASFNAWNNVTTSDLTFTIAGTTSGDIKSTNMRTVADPFLGTVVDADPNINEIIFDADSSILRDFFGGSPFLLGVGQPQTNGLTGEITKANFVIFSTNLDLQQRSGQDQLVAVLAHEAGHTVGFAHSPSAPNDPSATPSKTPQMYPFLVQDTVNITVDDAALAAVAYPSSTAATTLGKVSGIVHNSAGGNLFGALVELFPTSDLANPLLGSLSGAIAGEPDATYTIQGVPPGSYYARVESVAANFEAGRIGGIFESVASGFPAEVYFSAADFSQGKIITVAAGQTTIDINFGHFPEPEKSRVNPVISFPNPFFPTQGAIIRFQSRPMTALARCRILAVDGRLLKTIHVLDNAMEATWDGRSNTGEISGSGTYFVELEDATGVHYRGKFTLVK